MSDRNKIFGEESQKEWREREGYRMVLNMFGTFIAMLSGTEIPAKADPTVGYSQEGAVPNILAPFFGSFESKIKGPLVFKLVKDEGGRNLFLQRRILKHPITEEEIEIWQPRNPTITDLIAICREVPSDRVLEFADTALKMLSESESALREWEQKWEETKNAKKSD